MRISEIHVYAHDLPVRDGPYVIASSTVWSLQSTLIRIVADNGLVGWGGDIIAAACTYIGANVQPRLNEGVWIARPCITRNHDARNGIRITGGHIHLPQGPGLGISPDESLFDPPVASFS